MGDLMTAGGSTADKDGAGQRNEPKTWLNQPNPKAAFGATKPSLGLIPPSALHHTARALETGAAKYGAYNWRVDKVEALTYINAALRHIADYLDGADTAQDSGVHNLGHAIASLAIVLDATEVGTLIDDRPPPGKSESVSIRLQGEKRDRNAKT